MGKALEGVKGFVAVVFLLLGVLFGMQIMAFIFGNLGISGGTTFIDDTIQITNLTETFINSTTFTIPEASASTFQGNFIVLVALNATGVIPASDYTVFPATGIITNATPTQYLDVNLTYTFSRKSSTEQISDDVTNNSLTSIRTYTEQANTQLNTSAIAITLLILIAVFLVFWTIFIKGGKGKGESAGNFA